MNKSPKPMTIYTIVVKGQETDVLPFGSRSLELSQQMLMSRGEELIDEAVELAVEDGDDTPDLTVVQAEDKMSVRVVNADGDEVYELFLQAVSLVDVADI